MSENQAAPDANISPREKIAMLLGWVPCEPWEGYENRPCRWYEFNLPGLSVQSIEFPRGIFFPGCKISAGMSDEGVQEHFSNKYAMFPELTDWNVIRAVEGKLKARNLIGAYYSALTRIYDEQYKGEGPLPGMPTMLLYVTTEQCVAAALEVLGLDKEQEKENENV